MPGPDVDGNRTRVLDAENIEEEIMMYRRYFISEEAASYGGCG